MTLESLGLLTPAEEKLLDNLNTRFNLGQIVRRLADAVGDSDLKKTPLSDMADTGYENMSDGDGYILNEMKLAIRKLSEKIEAASTKSELQAVWKTVESRYALRAEVFQGLNALANQKDQFDIYRQDVTITAADLLTMNSAPIELVPAPGPGKYIDLVHVSMYLEHNTTPYTVGAGEDLSIQYAAAGEIVKFSSAGLFDAGTDQRRAGAPPSSDVPIGLGEAVQAKILLGELADGDSDLKIRCDYRVLDALV